MEMDLKDSRLREIMHNLGVVETDMNIQNAISCAVVQQAMFRQFESFSNYC